MLASERMQNRVTELLAQQANAMPRRMNLAALAASGDAKAERQLGAEVEAEQRRVIELADAERALAAARTAEEDQRRIEALKRAQAHAASALAASTESEAIAAKIEAAKRQLGNLIGSFAASRARVAQEAQHAVGAMSEAGLAPAPGAAENASRRHFSHTAFVEFVRDSRLRSMFPPQPFEALGRSGSPLIDWQAADRGVLAEEAAAMTNELKSALAAVWPEGKA